jgi:predicted RNase H-like nuclease (RuvC/YqgF family)
MMKSVKDWLSEGESLYSALVQEFQNVQQQMNELERTLSEKKTEVEQLAQVIARAGLNRPPRLDGDDASRRVADALRPQPDVAVRVL